LDGKEVGSPVGVEVIGAFVGWNDGGSVSTLVGAAEGFADG